MACFPATIAAVDHLLICAAGRRVIMNKRPFLPRGLFFVGQQLAHQRLKRRHA
jgi:hypothetical protein